MDTTSKDTGYVDYLLKGLGAHHVPQIKKVGNFLVDINIPLGEGQYGKVYLSQEITDQ
jgi:hypothetical protein